MRALQRGIEVAVLAGLLAGCSIFGGDGGGAPPAPAAGQSNPNLGTVPGQAPATSTTVEQQQIASGLVADQQNAGYSDQQLTAQSEQASAPPPVEVTTISPSTTAAADAEAAGTQPQATTVGTQPVESAPASAAEQPAGSTTAAVAEQQAEVSLAAPVAPIAPALAPTPVLVPALAQPQLPAPPPIPLPLATQMASIPLPTTASVSVDQSQLGGAPQREQLYPAPYAPFYGTPSIGAPAYGVAYSAAGPTSLPAPSSPIAVVFFEDASASLSDRAMGVLRDVMLIQKQQGGQLRIIGHASERTAALNYSEHLEINQRLSQARANAVARALIQFGAADGTISASAVGSQQPIYYEFMPTGEAGNRRVEVYLVGSSAPPLAMAPAPVQPVIAANGSVVVDLSVLDQQGPPTTAGGYNPYGQALSAVQASSEQLAYGSYPAQSLGGLLYPPTRNPASMLTVPPPPGSEIYVAEQSKAAVSSAAAAPPPSPPPTPAEVTAQTTTVPTVPTVPAAPAASTETTASTGGATTAEQSATTGTGATSSDIGSGAATTTESSTAAATTSGTETNTLAGSGTATGGQTPQVATGTTAATGTSASTATGGEMVTASSSGQAAATAPAAALADGEVRVAFAADSAEIPDAAKSELDSLAQKLAADVALRIELFAYASGTSDAASQARRMSLLRALAVRSYLIKQGVASTRMDVRALGNKVEGEPADRVDILPKSS